MFRQYKYEFYVGLCKLNTQSKHKHQNIIHRDRVTGRCTYTNRNEQENKYYNLYRDSDGKE